MNDYKYKLSIITINYNNLKGLKETFKSLFEQTERDFEYIVIDGGSSDGSREHIEANQNKINYWVSERDKGIYNAINKGIAQAQGKYILCLNSGDLLFDADTLRKSMPLMDLDYDLIYGDALCFNFIGGKSESVWKIPKRLSFHYFIHSTIPHQATLIHQRLHKKYGGYDENDKIVADWRFFMNVLTNHQATSSHMGFVFCKCDMSGISSREVDMVQVERKNVLKSNYGFILNDHADEIYIAEDFSNSLINDLGTIKYLKTKLRNLKKKYFI